MSASSSLFSVWEATTLPSLNSTRLDFLLDNTTLEGMDQPLLALDAAAPRPRPRAGGFLQSLFGARSPPAPFPASATPVLPYGAPLPARSARAPSLFGASNTRYPGVVSLGNLSNPPIASQLETLSPLIGVVLLLISFILFFSALNDNATVDVAALKRQFVLAVVVGLVAIALIIYGSYLSNSFERRYNAWIVSLSAADRARL